MSKQTLSTQCYEELMNSILKGEILPGTKLLCEELKTYYQVGMSPIREALSKLATTGLVSFEEHKGYSVNKLHSFQLIDEIESFAEIECLCFKHSIQKGNDSWEGEIISALHQLKKIEKMQGSLDFSAWNLANKQFHNSLVSSCSFKTLMQIRNQLYQRHQWYILLSYKFAGQTTLKANDKQHRKIGDLAIARKTNEAIDALYFHLTSGKQKLVEKLASKGLIYESI